MDFEINGNKFCFKKGFYRYVENIFIYEFGWCIGRNLNVFVDILRGGFGRYDLGEEIMVVWLNF